MKVIALDIRKPGNRLESQRCIAETTRALLSADWCAFITVNPITRKVYGPCTATGDLRERDIRPVKSWLERIADEAAKEKKLYVTEPAEAPDVLVESFNLKETKSVRVETLYTKLKQPMAVLFIGFSQPRELDSEEESDLSALVAQASLILEIIWLLGRYRAVHDIGQMLNRELSGYRDLFQKLHEEVASIIDTSYFFMLAVYKPQSNKHDRYFSLEEGNAVVQQEMELEGGCAAAIKRKRSLKTFYRSQDGEWDVAYVDMVGGAKPDSESLIFEPLIYRSEVLGVLTVQHPKPHAYDEEDVRIMKLLSNQVALALGNFRLFGYLETLNDVGQRLTKDLSSEDLLRDVAEEVRNATHADIITIYPYLPAEDSFGQPIYSGDLRRPEFLNPTVRSDNIAWLTLKKGEPVWAKDSKKLYKSLGGDPKKREGNFEAREEIASTAAVGLQIGNEAIGVLFTNFRVPQRFTKSQQNLILGLANYAAIAIKNYRKYTAANQRRLDDLEALQKIDRQMRQTPRLRDIMYAILEGAVKRIPAAAESAIILYNRRTKQLETAASIGSRSKEYETLSLNVKGGRGLTVWVYENKLPVRVDNVMTDPKWRDIYYPVISDTLSEMDYPLVDEDEVVGVISFESREEGAFSKEDEEFVRALAGQAVLAIKNAQLFETAESQRKELETLLELAQRISVLEDDPEIVMQLILKSACELLGAEMGALQLFSSQVDKGGVHDHYKVYVREAKAQDEEPIIEVLEPGATKRQVKLGIVKRVAETRSPYLTEGDAANDDYYEGSPDYHSEIAVPLISPVGELIGVLDLESPRTYAFDKDDLKVLEMFAQHAVIAIQYAQLYSLARAESEHFRVLSEAGRDLGKLTDIKQIGQAYEIILDKVAELSDGEILIRSFDETTEELVLEQVLNKRPTPPPERIPISRGINGQVARERRTIVVHDINDIPEGVAKPFGDDPSIRTLAITPIQQSPMTRYYGNLVLSHAKAFSLGKSDIDLLEGLAQQLAITTHRLEIVQARMEAEQQAKDLELVGELGSSGMEIAHRLSNELALVRVYINNIRFALANSGIESPVISEELEKVLRDVGNVLNMSRGLRQKVAEIGEEGKFARGRVTVPVRALLEDSSWTLPLPENINISWELAGNLAHVRVVPGQIVDIMRNLVANAIEVMPDGGRINIRAFNAGQYVQIEVEDTGPGIPLKDQAKIFNLFFSTKRSSGFGLWSARRYARANGGDLTMKSEPGRGATFILQLPMSDRSDGAGDMTSNEQEHSDR